MNKNGTGFLLRTPGLLPPSARQLLEKVGDEIISSLVIVRTPLSNTTKAFADMISLNQFSELSNKSFDKLFHLSLLINGKYFLEKNAVITFNTNTKISADSETQDVSINKQISISDMFEKTKKYMGDSLFSDYDAQTNNCQNFILACLKSSGFGSVSDFSFIKQDTDTLFKKLPFFSKILANLATNIGAIADRQQQGEGANVDMVQVRYNFIQFQHLKY